MGEIALLMTGAVLLMNGLVLLGIADPRTVAVINIWGGLLQTITPFVLLLQAHTPNDILATGPPFLFGLTFLWVGITALTGFPGIGVGWYCLWVVPITIVLAGVSYYTFADPRFTIVWLNYGVLWGLFWAVLALGKTELVRFTGWTTVFVAIWAVTAVAVLLLLGAWTKVPVWSLLLATAVSEIAAVLLARSGNLAARDSTMRQGELAR